MSDKHENERGEATTLAAGPELDALVAEKVMGFQWRWKIGGWINPPCAFLSPPDETKGEVVHDAATLSAMEARHTCYVPSYSTSIAAAWELVKKMLANGHLFGLSHDYPAHDDKWVASFSADGDLDVADTAPLAICLAALAVKGAKP